MNVTFSKIWIIVVLLVLIGGGVFAWQYFGALKEEKTITMEQLRNASYESLNAGSIQLADGEYRGVAENGQNIVVIIGKIAFGDINGDGREDTVVELSTSFGSGALYEFAVMINENGIPTYLSGQSFPYGLSITDISVDEAEIIVDFAPRLVSPEQEADTYQKVFRLVEDKIEGVRVTEIDTSGWQTYRNEEFGFEVEYPSLWKVHLDQDYFALDAESRSVRVNPVIYLYKDRLPEPPYNNGTFVAILPRGKEGSPIMPPGESHKVTEQLTLEVAEENREKLLVDGRVYGYLVKNFENFPLAWEFFGSVAGSVEIKNMQGTAREESLELSISGDIDDQDIQVVKTILSTFRFVEPSPATSSLEMERAVLMVEDLPKVKELAGRITERGGLLRVEVDHMDGDKYVIHVYEIVQGPEESHSATYGWYTVDLAAGEIRDFFGEVVQ